MGKKLADLPLGRLTANRRRARLTPIPFNDASIANTLGRARLRLAVKRPDNQTPLTAGGRWGSVEMPARKQQIANL